VTCTDVLLNQPLPLFPSVARSVRAMYWSVCRSGETEESHPGGGVFGSCCGSHSAGSCHVYCVSDWDGGISQGQQDSAAHGECCLSKHIYVCQASTILLVLFLVVTLKDSSPQNKNSVIITHSHVFPNHKTVVCLWNTNEDIFNEIEEISVPH